jgi:hypothetical protein
VEAETVAWPYGSEDVAIKSVTTRASVSVAGAWSVVVTNWGGSNKATKDGIVSVVPITGAATVSGTGSVTGVAVVD